MCPSLIEIGSKTAEKNCTNKQTSNKQTDRHYENNGHLAVNQNHHQVLFLLPCDTSKTMTNSTYRLPALRILSSIRIKEAACVFVIVSDTYRHGWCKATVSVVAPPTGHTATHRSNDTSPSTYASLTLSHRCVVETQPVFVQSIIL